ncbi:MAG: hypothetical protein ACYTCU_09430 [Planctomycetota bacterium]|jgi:hypothetical protein
MTVPARAALTALLALAAAAPLAAQGQLMERPASINGESITMEDIRSHARLVNQEMKGRDGEQLFHLTRRRIAEEILLAGEAERAGVELDQRMVDSYWESRNGTVPDYEMFAQYAGTSVERQKELARRAALANLYLYNKTGLRADFGAMVPPDPMLSRAVKVTPSQLREAFKANKQFFDRPARILVILYACANEDEVNQVMLAHAAGKEPEGVSNMPRAYPVENLEEVAEPELLPFLRAAQVGETQRYDTDQGILIASMVGREEAREATFAEVQEPLRNLLVTELLAEAQQHLVRQLAQQATF